MPEAVPAIHPILQLSWWTGLLGQNCLNPFTATWEIAKSAKEETENDNINSNLLDDSDDGLEQDNDFEDVGVPDDPISDYLDEWE